MKRHLPGLLGLLYFLAPAALAQELAEATLFTRVEGTTVQAVIRIETSDGWSLPHTELDDVQVARATYFELGGADIEWGEVRLPAPTTLSIDDGEEVHSLAVHSGEIIAFAAGTLGAGVDDGGATVSLDGQLVSANGDTEELFIDSVATSGPGTAALFASFPTNLTAPAAKKVAQDINPFGGASPAGGASGGADDEHGDGFDWTPNHSEMKADGRFFVEHDGKKAIGRIEIAIDEKDHFHLYHGPTLDDVGPNSPVAVPTELTLFGEGIEWDPVVFPFPEQVPGLDQEFNDIQINAHHGNIVLHVAGTVVEGAAIKGIGLDISGQTCNDTIGCIQYEQTLTAKVTRVDALDSEALPVAPEGASLERSADASGGDPEAPPPLWEFLLLAIMWGFITLLMPCTYPMIPITISFFTKQAAVRENGVLPLSIAYGAGIVVIYILIAVVIGQPIQRFANNPAFNLIIAGVFIFFAMTLFGWVNLQPPRFMNTMAAKASSKGGLIGVFLMGLTLVVTSFTCTAPFVGSLLAAGKDQSMFRLILGMGLFGLTMALPFVALSLFPSRLKKMPSAGQWMNVLKVFMGFVELAAAMKFLSTADLGWSWGLISKEIFLLSWFGIFLIAAMYLFGWINLKGEEDGVIGPGRMVGAVAAFMFAIYCGFLVFGFKMDPLLTAFAPPYSSAGSVGIVGGKGGGHGAKHEIILDDYDAALQAALDKEKLLLVNFTGWN